MPTEHTLPNTPNSSSALLLNALLLLDRRVVGVKFLPTEESFEHAEGKEFSGRITYCVMVKAATNGSSLKARLKNFACISGAATLGLTEPADQEKTAQFYLQEDMYGSDETCRDIYDGMTTCKETSYGVLLQPIEQYSSPEDADAIIAVVTPYQAMRLSQAYSYHFGTCATIKMTGNKAFCSECTAYPLEHDQMNTSLLCAGTRYKANWDDSEMAVGLPASKLEQVVDGLLKTLNAMEPNEKKEQIEQRLAELEIEHQIVMNKNYHTGLFLD